MNIKHDQGVATRVTCSKCNREKVVIIKKRSTANLRCRDCGKGRLRA